jgi:hypothetical protein
MSIAVSPVERTVLITTGGGTSQRCMECKFGIEDLLRTWHTKLLILQVPPMMYKTKLFSLLLEILTLTKSGIYIHFQNQVKNACKIS